jgi:TadE-like protein
MRLIGRLRPRTRGQALVEFALVFPLFLLLLMTLIVFGLYVFYNQQLSNAAREAARFAAVHSVTSQCPVVSQLDPIKTLQPPDNKYTRCDAPESGWPNMTGAARSKIWGMAPNQVSLTACWSGFINPTTLQRDEKPNTPGVVFTDCTISGIDPQTNPSSLPCPAPMTTPSTNPNREAAPADGDDKASSLAVVGGSTGADTHYPTTVTVYTCFNWRPPMAGFVVIPNQIALRAVITEAVQRQ